MILLFLHARDCGEVDLWDGATHVEFNGSNAVDDDVWGDLARAVLALLLGEHSVEVTILEEPGDNRFLFQRADDRVRLRVKRFLAWAGPGGFHDTTWADDHEIIFDAETTLDELGANVLSEFDRIAEQYGQAEFLELHEPVVRAVDEIRAFLPQSDPTGTR